jgi:hypothetical protein
MPAVCQVRNVPTAPRRRQLYPAAVRVSEHRPRTRADRKRPAGPGPRRLRPDAGRHQQRRRYHVPVDARAFGHWLNLLLGPATTVASGSASGDIVFSAQPAVNSTITINGVVFTFVLRARPARKSTSARSLTQHARQCGDRAERQRRRPASPPRPIRRSAERRCTSPMTRRALAGNAFTLAASTSPASNGTVSGATLTGGGEAHVHQRRGEPARSAWKPPSRTCPAMK